LQFNAKTQSNGQIAKGILVVPRHLLGRADVIGNGLFSFAPFASFTFQSPF
jgi:hypothetical protein